MDNVQPSLQCEYVMKQLIMPHDIHEVTMQKRNLDTP